MLPAALGATRIPCYLGARFLVHAPVNVCCGTPAELRREADELETIVGRVWDILLARCRKPEVVSAWLAAGDHYFGADEALQLGLVDEIIPRPPTPALLRQAAAGPPGKTESELLFESFLRAFGKIEVHDRARFERHLGEWASANVRAVP